MNIKNTIDKEYDWVGDWEAPGYGAYVIREDSRELEPGEVIEYIKRLQDILLQGIRQNDSFTLRIEKLKKENDDILQKEPIKPWVDA